MRTSIAFYQETPRLSLKVLGAEYAPLVLEFYQENQISFEPYEPDRPENFYTKKYHAASLKGEYHLALKLAFLRYYVFEKDRPERIVGSISFNEIKYGYRRSCQLGYKFHQDFRGCGYAFESINKAVSLAFSDMKLHRIEALVMPSNLPSIRLLERLEFQKEGVCRSCLRFDGHWEDHLLFSKLEAPPHP